MLVTHWLLLLKECLEQGEVSVMWNESIMIVVPKSKACPMDPAS